MDEIRARLVAEQGRLEWEVWWNAWKAREAKIEEEMEKARRRL